MTKDKLQWLKHLYPGYFALTMATGIITIGLDMWHVDAIAQAFYGMTLFSWCVLFVLYTWRLLVFPKEVLENLLNPKTTFIFFSFVAATNLCGVLLINSGYQTLALACWVLAFLFWSVLMYFSFAALSFSHPDRNVNVVHGGWLILIVGTQSLVILGSKIATELGEFAGYMMVEIHMLWALGMIFYAIFVTLFCYRIFFMDMQLSDFSPLMWVIMGAAAISANAGTNLLLNDPIFPSLIDLRPVVKMMSIMLWTWATWWIPLLVLFGLWKHVYHKLPMVYDPMQWSIVFPLGMYTVATNNLALSAEFKPLSYFSHGMLWVALIVWFVTFIGLIRSRFIQTNKS